jgi:hypothetical protein
MFMKIRKPASKNRVSRFFFICLALPEGGFLVQPPSSRSLPCLVCLLMISNSLPYPSRIHVSAYSIAPAVFGLVEHFVSFIEQCL